MITTTLNRIREHDPCQDGWKTLLKGLGKTKADDEPVSFVRIVEINGLDDALWCCRVEPEHEREWRLFAVWCARQVQHLMKDPRSLAALDVAERQANGLVTDGELAVARDDAWAAARDGESAAAWAAAGTGAGTAASVAAEAAARAAARDATRDATRDAQKAEFLRVVGGAT